MGTFYNKIRAQEALAQYIKEHDHYNFWMNEITPKAKSYQYYKNLADKQYGIEQEKALNKTLGNK